nr:hypothetical protein BACY1_25360 [Tenacibaculum mesophilum]
MKKILFIHLLLFVAGLNAQIKDTLPNFNNEYILVKEGDSLMIKLNEVTVLPKHKFKEKKIFFIIIGFEKKYSKHILMQF